ncbi:DUF3343 domain-containing protein [Halanaerobium saccharolyticum]|uniref:DUF3343 domain-containing protein n=1 Tax=Halanaerobium saccharolyticum TaxID=43595 RepID=UPI003FCDD136
MGVKQDKLILFQSTHHSIKAEKVFMENDLLYRMAAVPPEISTDCGSAIAVPAELEELKELLEQNDILVEAVYEVSENKNGKKYRKIYSAE